MSSIAEAKILLDSVELYMMSQVTPSAPTMAKIYNYIGKQAAQIVCRHQFHVACCASQTQFWKLEVKVGNSPP